MSGLGTLNKRNQRASCVKINALALFPRADKSTWQHLLLGRESSFRKNISVSRMTPTEQLGSWGGESFDHSMGGLPAARTQETPIANGRGEKGNWICG